MKLDDLVQKPFALPRRLKYSFSLHPPLLHLFLIVFMTVQFCRGFKKFSNLVPYTQQCRVCQFYPRVDGPTEDSERRIFEKFLQQIYLFSDFLQQVCWGSHPKKYIFYILLCSRCLSQELNHGLLSNRSTLYILDYDIVGKSYWILFLIYRI